MCFRLRCRPCASAPRTFPIWCGISWCGSAPRKANRSAWSRRGAWPARALSLARQCAAIGERGVPRGGAGRRRQHRRRRIPADRRAESTTCVRRTRQSRPAIRHLPCSHDAPGMIVEPDTGLANHVRSTGRIAASRCRGPCAAARGDRGRPDPLRDQPIIAARCRKSRAGCGSAVRPCTASWKAWALRRPTVRSGQRFRGCRVTLTRNSVNFRGDRIARRRI